MSHTYRATLSLLAIAYALPCMAQTMTLPQEKFLKDVLGVNLQEEKAKAEVVELLYSKSRVVQGKPYAAESQTEVVQTLADGNRMVRHTSSKFFRDSSGRTRREQTFSAINASIPGETKIFIDDPVGNVAWVVDPGTHSAKKIAGKYLAERDAMLMTEAQPVGPAKLPPLNEGRDIATEQLGQKVIEGVQCDGKRDTITIPAGKIGNERPVVIVTETWTSPVIGAIVQSSTTDPRFGQTTYQMLNLRLGEPQASLFAPPANYQIEASK